MDYSILSQYRSKIMAIAMIWIACFHASCWFSNKLIGFIQTNGFGGVDIFIFLFSLGAYYSLRKENHLLSFYKKRFIRIFPYTVPVFVYIAVTNHYDIMSLFYFVTTLDFWIHWNIVLWFIPALVVFILISPFAYHLLEKNKWMFLLAAIVSSVACCYFYLNKTQMIFASRVPVFFLGFIFGKWSYEKRKLSSWGCLILIIIMAAGLYFLYYNYHHFGAYMWTYGLYWYPFILIVPGLCVFCGIVLMRFESLYHHNFLSSSLNYLGRYTLEFYLFHEMLIKAVDSRLVLPWDYHGVLRNVFTAAITVVLAIVYQACIKKAVSKISSLF